MQIVNGTFHRSNIKRGTEREFTGHWYSTSYSSNLVLTTQPKRLRFNTANIICRDQFVPSFNGALKNLRIKHPNLILTSEGEDLVLDAHFSSPTKAKIATIAILGNTNRNFSPMASPFIIRFIEGASRVTGRSTLPKTIGDDLTVEEAREIVENKMTLTATLTWFYNLMKRADQEGVKLNPNVMESWAAGVMEPAYAMLGLVTLKNSSATAVMKRTVDYNLMFPPNALRSRTTTEEEEGDDDGE